MRFNDSPAIIKALSRIAREELRHFEQVLTIIKRRDIKIDHLIALRYAKSLYACARVNSDNSLVDQLLISGIIEARSCERFYQLAHTIDNDLSTTYQKLYQAEFLHFEFFIDLALRMKSDCNHQLNRLLRHEKALIEQPESILRFHSGIPAVNSATNSLSSPKNFTTLIER
jgi:tRNA 2-(methylsulfanyl)-N6-isopentenyladenosine37 hydroxylase